MGQYTFREIKKRILEWSQTDILRYLSKKENIVLSKNNDDILLIDLTFPNCLAQIIVEIPSFAPYQFVIFEAMAVESEKTLAIGSPDIIYFFFDTIEMSEKEVIGQLEEGIRYCSCYIPNQLKKEHLNKKGMITRENGDLHYIVHPDDMNKLNSEIFKEVFICKDVELQYLLIEKDALLLRILPRFFKEI